MSYIIEAAIITKITGRQQIKFIATDKHSATRSAQLLHNLFASMCQYEQGKYPFTILVMDTNIRPPAQLVKYDSPWGKCEYEHPVSPLTTGVSART